MTDNADLSAVVWRLRAKRLVDTLLNSVLPPVCANCHTVGALLCTSCLAQLPRISGPICSRCGRKLFQPASVCPACRQRHPLLNQIRAAVLFREAVPGLIHKLKYQGLYALSEPLASLMVECWPVGLDSFDLVLPVPLHPKRKQRRGYNQAELLANHLCQQLQLPCEPAALKRVRHTRPQVDLNSVERQANVAGAFAAERTRVQGRALLLIDDVCTTGSTLSAAADALISAGARSVSGYCLAQAG